jgi:sulfite reductase (NADPH) flavoprotein alpha-component
MNTSLADALTSPLADDRATLLRALTEGLEPAALQWISGYAAGLAAQQTQLRHALPLHAVPNEAPVVERLSIVYGSQTGNAKREAESLARDAQAKGIAVRLLRADAYPLKELADERLLTVVISTQGEGDPPDDALAFVEFLNGRKAPKLDQLHFAVLGLGDSSYAQFNAVARRIDARLAELGGTRWTAVAEADVDIATVAGPWREQTIAIVGERLKTVKPSAQITALRTALPPAPVLFTRNNPYSAELFVNQRITGRQSGQDVRHLEIGLDATLAYEPGDALGVWARNAEALVSRTLSLTGLRADQSVSMDGRELALDQWLSRERELTRLSKRFVQEHAERHDVDALKTLLKPEHQSDLSHLLGNLQVPDFLQRFPGKWQAEQLLSALRPMAPRLYSIASSRKTVGDEAHLTVALLNYNDENGMHQGLASGWLSTRTESEQLPVFVEANERFRLPKDSNRDILMIGPGTGVAPFRGFLQERSETAARGRNWLLFGARHAESQFLYQLEWQQALKSGLLHKLDLAFSRDQAERVYVQQRLRENAAEVYAWLQGGAHVYVCGAIAMGKDVHQALLAIVQSQGGLSDEAAAEYLSTLQQSGRYARDVY